MQSAPWLLCRPRISAVCPLALVQLCSSDSFCLLVLTLLIVWTGTTRRNEAKIGLLERQYDELVQKYEDRESRPEDLERLAEMEERLRRAEEEVVRVEDEMKYFKMELRNREQNFNQVFGGGASHLAQLTSSVLRTACPFRVHVFCLVDHVAIKILSAVFAA